MTTLGPTSTVVALRASSSRRGAVLLMMVTPVMKAKSVSGSTYSHAGSGVSSSCEQLRSSTVRFAYSAMRSTCGKCPTTVTFLRSDASIRGRYSSKASILRTVPSGSSMGSS